MNREYLQKFANNLKRIRKVRRVGKAGRRAHLIKIVVWRAKP